ncbi:hypothetical protein [Peribacillus sp. SCS-155]|uniref:hypothetical protein n=1 Tax=Peribacillus sedimenti TaxID=3115297 RepID=UPI00390615F2
MKQMSLILFLLLITSACNHDIPEPENKIENKTQVEKKDVEAAGPVSATGAEPFIVKYNQKGDSLFIECLLKDYTFSDAPGKPQVFVSMYMDGRKLGDYQTAAFIVKEIPEGTHKVKLMVKDPDGHTEGLSREFTVYIDSLL